MARKKKTAPPDNWDRLLPEQFRGNPHVIVTLIPTNSEVYRYESKDGEFAAGVVKSKRGQIRALQVLHPSIPRYMDNVEVFEGMDLDMMDPRYIGRLRDIPNDVLTRTTLVPLVFLRDQMDVPFLNLRAWAHQLETKGASVN